MRISANVRNTIELPRRTVVEYSTLREYNLPNLVGDLRGSIGSVPAINRPLGQDSVWVIALVLTK